MTKIRRTRHFVQSRNIGNMSFEQLVIYVGDQYKCHHQSLSVTVCKYGENFS